MTEKTFTPAKYEDATPVVHSPLETMLANPDAIAKMPFTIFRGETEVDTSAEYKNVTGVMPNPRRTLKLVEMSLALMGMAYLFNIRNNVRTLELKYLNPTTIEPVITEDAGLVGFIRTLTKPIKYKVEDIIYFWLADPYVELGEPKSSPATATTRTSISA